MAATAARVVDASSFSTASLSHIVLQGLGFGASIDKSDFSNRNVSPIQAEANEYFASRREAKLDVTLKSTKDRLLQDYNTQIGELYRFALTQDNSGQGIAGYYTGMCEPLPGFDSINIPVMLKTINIYYMRDSVLYWSLGYLKRAGQQWTALKALPGGVSEISFDDGKFSTRKFEVENKKSDGDIERGTFYFSPQILYLDMHDSNSTHLRLKHCPLAPHM